jgi:hypothetical protein
MSEWFNDMSQSLLPALRSFFELELLYSYVYILSPSSRVPHIHEYAQRLIFEHCIAYSTNLLANISTSSHTTKPPVTFYDAMRAYMTGRQFIDVLSRNIDVILDPRQPSPPVPSGPTPSSDDPLAPPATAPPPLFPTPLLPDGQTVPQDPTTRAINAINDFTTILSRFGLRFGFTHWRDRFQRESGPLLSQLYQRASISPLASSPSHQIPSQQWMSVPASSPQQIYSHRIPSTPPSAYPPQSSPFATSPFSTSPYNGNHFPQSQGQMPDWTTSSPQPVSEMPQPGGGRSRQALVYGPGISAHRQGQSPGRASGIVQDSLQGQGQGHGQGTWG